MGGIAIRFLSWIGPTEIGVSAWLTLSLPDQRNGAAWLCALCHRVAARECSVPVRWSVQRSAASLDVRSRYQIAPTFTSRTQAECSEPGAQLPGSEAAAWRAYSTSTSKSGSRKSRRVETRAIGIWSMTDTASLYAAIWGR